MTIDRDAKLRELEHLRSSVSSLERELGVAGGESMESGMGVGAVSPVASMGEGTAYGGEPSWPPKSYYTAYHIMAGMVLGFIAATTSLLVNVIGAAMLSKHPLELIRVYLTFPLGERALNLESGFALAAGCCLYLGTGMFGGIPFHLVLSRYFSQSNMFVRFAVATVMGIGIWLINFYGLIAWVQPMLIGGNWIVETIPLPVAIFTHLVFGWTMLLVDQWGRFVPPQVAIAE
ncbi:MAG: hypothetical protein ACPGXK_11980 [Phycisphaerae bacterium]